MKIKNRHLSLIINFLKNEIKATRVDNIHRMRVVKELEKRLEEFSSEEVSLVKDFAVLDDDGNIKQTEGGGFYVRDREEFERHQNILLDEEFSISNENLSEALVSVKSLVENHEGELSGESAEAHYILSVAMEKIKNGDDE